MAAWVRWPQPRGTGGEALLSDQDQVADKQYGTVIVSHTHFLCVLLWVLHFILTLQ